MIEAGAKGYLLKSTSASVIVEAILAVKRGETFYCSAALQSMVRLLPHRDHISQSKASQKRLTEKEVEITKMICKQFTSKEIAHHLQISRRTVEDCSKRIKEKTGAKSIAGIVLHAVKNEIITLNEI